MRFRPDQPHGQVYGVPGVHWHQNGHNFTIDGRLVEGDPDHEREMDEIAQQLADPKLAPEAADVLRRRLAVIKKPEPVAAPAHEAEPKPDLRRRENKHLRDIYGEREDAA